MLPREAQRQPKRKRVKKMVPHGPGGQRLRPAPKTRVQPRTPQAKAQGRRVVQRAANPIGRRGGGTIPTEAQRQHISQGEAVEKVANRKNAAQKKKRRRIARFKGNAATELARSEQNAIQALSELRASNPKKYDANTRKASKAPEKIRSALEKDDPLTIGGKTALGAADSLRKRFKPRGVNQHSFAASTTPQLHALASSEASKTAGTILERGAREAIDLPANAIPQTVRILKPVYDNPTRPKAYKQTAKRVEEAVTALPKEYIKAIDKKGLKGAGEVFVQHPLSTTLTVAPIPRLPGLAAGRVARATGKMPAGPSPRVLPETAFKEGIPRSKSYFKARRQTKKGVQQVTEKKPFPQKLGRGLTKSPIERRVDEEVGLMEGQARRVQAETYRKAYRARKKVVSKTEARHDAATLALKEKEKTQDAHKLAIVEGMALREKPKVALSGKELVAGGQVRKFDNIRDAELAAGRYNNNPAYKVEMAPVKHGNGFAVIPKSAVDRLAGHEAVTKVGPIEAAFKAYNTLWRKNVLATHPTWYAGNVIEAAGRSLVEGVGPRDYYRGYKTPGVLKKSGSKADFAAYDATKGHTSRGGHFAMQAHLPEESHLSITGASGLADMARSLQRVRDKPVIRNVADAWTRATDLAMGTLSGSVESFFQTGMMGKALKESPLMDNHIRKTSNAAMADAAKGLKETHNQVMLGQAVDRMYGQYGKFSPGMRRAIANYTPFIAWTLNSLNWLYHYLPRDHPVLTAAAASSQPYVDEWLKEQGLSAFVKGSLPPFLRGSLPKKGGERTRFPTRYTPFSVAAGFPESVGTSLLPQVEGAYNVLVHEINWKGQKLKNPDDSPLDPIQLSLLAALTMLEGMVPASQQFVGPAQNYEEGARTSKKLFKPKSGEEIVRAFNPLAPIPQQGKSKKKPKNDLDSLIGGETPKRKPKKKSNTLDSLINP